jgi:hypothetical protein
MSMLDRYVYDRGLPIEADVDRRDRLEDQIVDRTGFDRAEIVVARQRNARRRNELEVVREERGRRLDVPVDQRPEAGQLERAQALGLGRFGGRARAASAPVGHSI